MTYYNRNQLLSRIVNTKTSITVIEVRSGLILLNKYRFDNTHTLDYVRLYLREELKK